MKFLKVLKHIGIIAAGVILIIGVPLWCTGYITSLFSDEADVVSGASLIIDRPSGEFVVLINKKLHTNKENLEKWVKYFSGTEGDEILIIFEDISCSVAEGDVTGLNMAESFQSRLGTSSTGLNQMEIEQSEASLLVSRADYGKFDVIIMSKEFADAYSLDTAYGSDVEVVELSGEVSK